MTQKHVHHSAYALFLVLGVNTTRAETENEGTRELLPTPKCCCTQLKDDGMLVTTEGHARGRVVLRVHPLGSLVAPADPVILSLGDGDLLFGWFTQTPAGVRLLEETPEDLLIN